MKIIHTFATLGLTALMLTACGKSESKEPSESEIRPMIEKGLTVLFPNEPVVLKEVKKGDCTAVGPDKVSCKVKMSIEMKDPETNEVSVRTQEPDIVFRKVNGQWVDSVE